MEIITEESKNINHYLVNRCFGRRHPPHEMIFTEVLLKHEFKDPKVSEQFVAFVSQFFPDYDWQWINYMDLQNMAVVNAHMNHFVFMQRHEFKEEDISEEQYSRAKKFGEIATEFCIRNRNYTLIGCGGSKTIISARDRVYDEFGDYLNDGYLLFRSKKTYYVENPNSFFGYFEELPALPLDDLYNYFDEYIENNKHNYVKTINNTPYKK